MMVSAVSVQMTMVSAKTSKMPKALLNRPLRVRRRVGDGRRAEAGLVGECAPAQAPDNGLLQRNACRRTADSTGRECTRKDLGEGRADVACVGKDHDDRKDDVEHAHERNELFRDRTDALDAAEEDQRDGRRDRNAEDEVQQVALTFSGRDKGVDCVVE